MGEEWRPQGDRIGYIEDDNLYLVPQAAYRAAQNVGGEGSGLAITALTLNKRLSERGYLRSTDRNRDTLTVRRVLESARREVLHLHPHTLFPSADSSDQPDQSDHESPAEPVFSGQDGRIGQVVPPVEEARATGNSLVLTGEDSPTRPAGAITYGND